MNQPPKIISWIKAARFRTLPLALSSVIMGSFLAIADGHLHPWIVFLALLTTLFLQILSNFANDYGDAVKGTDNEHRLGPQRTVQGGEIDRNQMQRGIITVAFISLLSGSLLIYLALGDNWLQGLIFLALGLASIAAAIKYVVGENAYGYRGFGDLFVFLFFGLVGVVGTYFLITKNAHLYVWLPAITLGLFSTGVLNLNNMRDVINDKNSGKITIPVRLGKQMSMTYHVLLIVFGWLASLLFTLLNYHNPWQFLYFLLLPVFIFDLFNIHRCQDEQALDPFLKRLALETLAYTLLFGLGLLLS